MKIDIQLSKYNKSLLKKLCKDLFPTFHYVKIRRKEAIFKKRWYSLDKRSTHIAELVLLRLPNALNNYYQENEFNPPFPKIMDMHSAIDHIAPLLQGGNIISFLYKKYNDVAFTIALKEEYSEEPITIKEEVVEVEESKMTFNEFKETVKYYIKQVFDINSLIEPHLRVVYFNSNSSCNSPPIRAPSEVRLIA